MQTPSGCLVFDDTVVDKNFSHKIALVRRQYRGKVHGIIKGGGGGVIYAYINPELDQFWIIDCCIYDPAGDGQAKLDPVTEWQDRLLSAQEQSTGR